MAPFDAPLLTRPREPTPREQELFQDIMQEFAALQTWRLTFAGHWEEVAELVLPTSRNTFFYGSYNTQGQKKTDRQVDASGMMALSRFAAICDSLLTPRNMFWHGLQSDPYVMKDRQTALWFERVTKTLFKHRYSPHSNFSSQNQQIFQSLGAFGTAGMFTDELDTSIGGSRGLRYRANPLGELFIRENHQGIVDGVIRWFRLTARQCMQKWGPERFPETLRPALVSNSETLFDFIHRVCARRDYDPQRLDAKGKRFESTYACLAGRAIMQEGGYRTFPYSITRYEQTPGEVYGRSPAMMVLPALKTLNAEKRVFLKQGHRAADPVLLTADDGVVGMSMRPGATNAGGVTADGKLLVHVLPTGDIQITKEMMADEKSLINDAFLVTLFQILTETPQMTATEVIERTNEKGILLAPTVGRQQSEYLGPLIDRELDVLGAQGLIPPMPPRLREARGEYEPVYTSPLSRAMRAQEAAGFIRSVEISKEIVNITQDPSYLDPYDFDAATPAIAEINGVPPSWMADDKSIAAKRKSRQQAQERAQQVQELPAKAAMVKANAVAAKAGQPVGPAEAPAGRTSPPLAQQVLGA